MHAEPLQITVSVGRILHEESDSWSQYYEAFDELDRQREEVVAREPDADVPLPESPEHLEGYLHLRAQQARHLETIESLSSRLEEQRQREWRAYGAALKQAIEGLPKDPINVSVGVRVTVTLDADPAQHTEMTEAGAVLVKRATELVATPADLPGTPLSRLV